MCCPCAASRASTRFAIVDLPAPLKPVNQTTQARCRFIAARAFLLTARGCQVRFAARRSANVIAPPATVSLVRRSIMMNDPMARFAASGSNVTGVSTAKAQ